MVRALKRGEASGVERDGRSAKRLAQIYSTSGNSLERGVGDESEAVTSTRMMAMARGGCDAKRRRGALRRRRHLPSFSRQTGRKAYAALNLLGMVGPLCMRARWGLGDESLEHWLDLSTLPRIRPVSACWPPADHVQHGSIATVPPLQIFSRLFYKVPSSDSYGKQQMLSISKSTPNFLLMNTKSEALGRAALNHVLIDPDAPRKRRELLVVHRIGRSEVVAIADSWRSR
ncbi:hypothetical protein QBC39DRAFT_91980 [Podospora conica]|nr:hypothetical protein QBC39DRAFT_91980 [Schizothecium conicum]